MHKLAIAAVVTATVGAAGGVFVATTRNDAHAAKTHSHDVTRGCTAAKPAAHAKGGTLCDVMMASAKRQAPSLSALVDGTSAGAESNDCAAVGRHLQELEADTTHGPDDRPDDAFCEKCTQYYTNLCESQAWTVERRNCTLAAPDLINAHMCSGTVPTRDPNAQIPANLSCAVLGPHIATIIQAAGMHADVADMPQQVEAACEVGQWTIEIRTCLANGTTIMALQACIIPDAEAH